MAITPVPQYTGDIPQIGQNQPTFNQNTSDMFDYIGTIADGINTTASEIDTASQSVDDNRDLAEQAANTATGAVNFAGAFVSGSTSAIKGNSYSFDGGYWICLTDTTTDPSVANASWKKSLSVDDLNDLERRVTGVGVQYYRGSNGSYVQNGDEVPVGTTHLAVLINGKVEDLVAWDELTLPAVITVVPTTFNEFLECEISTNQGVFKFVSEKTFNLRNGSSFDGGDCVYAAGFGVNNDETDQTSKMLTAANYAKSKGSTLLGLGLSSSKRIKLSGDVQMPSELKLEKCWFILDFDLGVTTTNLRFADSSQLKNIRIEAGGNDYSLQEQVQSGVTYGLKYSSLERIVCTGAAVSDFYLRGYHFLMSMKHCYSYSNCSSYGIDIDNVDLVANPDVSLEECYVNGPVRGYQLRNVSAVLKSCSADNTTDTPLALNNAFCKFISCGFELIQKWLSINSSSADFEACSITTHTGTMADDSGNKFMILCGGGTYPGSVTIRGGILLNQSNAEIYAVRTLDSSPAAQATIARDVEFRENTFGIKRFLYQSVSSPSVVAARLCTYGDSSHNANCSGVAPSLSADFNLDFSPSSDIYMITDACVLRYITWREIGADTAGATTTVNLVIYNADGTVRKTVSSVIAISGVTSGSPKRYGSKIIDEDLIAGEFIQFDIGSSGERANTGITITSTFNS